MRPRWRLLLSSVHPRPCERAILAPFPRCRQRLRCPRPPASGCGQSRPEACERRPWCVVCVGVCGGGLKFRKRARPPRLAFSLGVCVCERERRERLSSLERRGPPPSHLARSVSSSQLPGRARRTMMAPDYPTAAAAAHPAPPHPPAAAMASTALATLTSAGGVGLGGDEANSGRSLGSGGGVPPSARSIPGESMCGQGVSAVCAYVWWWCGGCGRSPRAVFFSLWFACAHFQAPPRGVCTLPLSPGA